MRKRRGNFSQQFSSFRRWRKYLQIALIVAACLFAGLGAKSAGKPEKFGKKYLGQRDRANREKRETRRSRSQLREITAVIDGDTLTFDHNEKVRLLGVDTPESRDNDKLARDAARSRVNPQKVMQLGKAAAEFTRKRCARAGNRAYLRFSDEQDATDRYGRTLAYVEFPDGTILNEELLRQGYAQAMRKYPHAERSRYLQLEGEAKSAKRGLWKNRVFTHLAHR